jgi:Zn-dependent protease with chaperone function
MQRWIAIIAFLAYDFIQIYIVGHLIVEPNANYIIRYQVRWSPEFQLDTLTLLGLLLIPFVISYIMALNSVGGDMVQIIGPDSLMKRMQMEFHRGNPEARDFTEDEVDHFLLELSTGEPQGTFENLKMLFHLGIITQTLINQTGIKSIKRVFVSDDLTPNAFTLRVLPIPFLGQDWIIINRNVVDILDDQEIKSVIAHEIGHAARRDSWLNAMLYSPRLVIIFGWSIILAAMANVILNEPFTLDSMLRFATLLGFIGVIRYLMNAGQGVINYAYRRTELLADYYAAKIIGLEDLINALIKIGSRGEVINSISRELKRLEKMSGEVPIEQMAVQIMNYLDPSETDAAVAKEYAVEFYVRSKLNQIFRGFQISISDSEFNNYVQQAKANMLKSQVSATPLISESEEQVKDWKSVDIDQNKKLDIEEIKDLVLQLRKNDSSIFQSELLERTGQLPQVKTHPQVSQRIFFLHDNLMD